MIPRGARLPRLHPRRCVAAVFAVLAVLGSRATIHAQVDVEVELDRRDPARAARAVLFAPPGFPTVDGTELDRATLGDALRGLPVERIESVGELAERLRLARYDVLILPHGSAFPLDAWPAIRAFLGGGGGLVVLGGAPFHQPVLGGSVAEYRLGVRQPTFAHDLLIGPAEPWTAASPIGSEEPEGTPQAAEAKALDESFSALAVPEDATVWALTVRLATRKNLEGEHGSEGYRDAVLRPLVHLVDGRGLPVACPALEIDHLRGAAAGARWVLVPTDAPLSGSVIRAAVERALAGASQLEARPVHASVEPGEVPLILIAQRRPVVAVADTIPERATVTVRDDAGVEVFRGEAVLDGQPESRHGVAEVRAAAPLSPGLYRVEVSVEEGVISPSRAATGFWVRDAALLASGPKVTVSRDWLRRDGAVFPIVGTTYMASDVHRKFLFEPDPATWDRDFAQMAELGINFVRTGLWTAWSRAMLDPGAIDEGFLRALDAWIQTAARHGIVVNFTFFAFLPPAFGGDNPYLDPRALEGQRDFLTLVARRYRGVGWVHWDLINEPSYAPPEGLWSNRPIGDPWETRAWQEWIVEHHGSGGDGTGAEVAGGRTVDLALLRDRWQDPSMDPMRQPEHWELYQGAIRDRRRPRKMRDFVIFSHEAVAGWAARLRADLRAAGGDVLVTLGQDEGGTFTRPAQQLHAEAVDYTGVHPWWQNDDLLATGVLTKVPEKPNLFQETGLMRLEDLDGRPWRSPELAARVLEAKFAYAFAARAGGVIEWAWNINPYQPIDNESVIGFFRPAGTAKPELRVIPELAAFFDAAAPHLDDFEPDPVIVVIPHSRLFLGHPGGADGVKRLIRVLAERFGVVPTGLSDLRLTPERLAHARLIVAAGPVVLEDSAAQALLAASRAGTKVLVTGAVLGDPYGATPPALEELGIVDEGRPVAFRETTRWGEEGWATFDLNLRESLRRSERAELGALEGADEPDGPEAPAGNVWHEPLPLEFAREDEPLAALLGAALEAAGVETHPGDGHVAARVLRAPRASLVVVVNETAADTVRTVTIEGRSVGIPVRAGRSRLALFERGTGRLIVATAGDPIAVGP
ncbi:MAG TPA: hypothetical protein VMT85_04340 [Thermoanaerobaculia bacterium]|nr:hypothetical protein [Thermoanaerobaculia bacterium]